MSNRVTSACALAVLTGSFLSLLLLLPTLRLISRTAVSPGSARLRRSVSRDDEPLSRRLVSQGRPTVIQKDGPDLDFGPGTPAFGKDVFITVKTTAKFHKTRIRDILDTWYRLAPDKVYFVSDRPSEKITAAIGDHFIATTCRPSHSTLGLCCKMGAEINAYLQSNASWFCHFDDDNYVNVPMLMKLLSDFDPQEDWYLGKPSTREPIQVKDHENGERYLFRFATGGAGICLSRALALKLIPFVSAGRFSDMCSKLMLPDDVTFGYIIEVLLEKKLTVISNFHSHLEEMRLIAPSKLAEQISLSAGSYNDVPNVVSINGYFPVREDPTRFRSIHCFLIPNAWVCRHLKAKKNRF